MSTSGDILAGDGLNENLYHLLWTRDPLSDSVPRVCIPHTVIFRYRQPSFWYFTSVVDGTIKRKTMARVNNYTIEAEFTRKPSKSGIVATYMYNAVENGLTKTVMEYCDAAKLHEVLFTRDKVHNGILQKFVHPKGSRNLMVRALWSPKILLMERRVNKHPIDDKKIDLYERAVTFEGPTFHSELHPVRGAVLTDKVHDIALSMVHHIAAITGDKIRVSRMALNFTIDESDKLWLLMASSIRLDDEMKRSMRSPRKKALATQKVGVQNTPLEANTLLTQPSYVRVAGSASTRTPILLQQTRKCPICFQGAASDAIHELFYHTLIRYEEEMRETSRWNLGDLPDMVDGVHSVIRRLHPNILPAKYATYQRDPNFLYERVMLCEDCALRFSSLSMGGKFKFDDPWAKETPPEEEEFQGTGQLGPERLRDRFDRTRRHIASKKTQELKDRILARKKNAKLLHAARSLPVFKKVEPCVFPRIHAAGFATAPTDLEWATFSPRKPRVKPQHWEESLRAHTVSKTYLPTYAQPFRKRSEKALRRKPELSKLSQEVTTKLAAAVGENVAHDPTTGVDHHRATISSPVRKTVRPSSQTDSTRPSTSTSHTAGGGRIIAQLPKLCESADTKAVGLL